MSGETNSQMQGSVVAAGLIIIAIIAIAALGIGFTLYPFTTEYEFDFSAQQSVNKFSSCEELEAFLEEKYESSSYGTFASGLAAPMAMQRSMELGAVQAPSAAPDMESSGLAQKADDYSTTNIQVEGVDEADLKLYNMTGTLVHEDAHFTPGRTINLRNQPEGAYLVRIKAGREVIGKILYKQ